MKQLKYLLNNSTYLFSFKGYAVEFSWNLNHYPKKVGYFTHDEVVPYYRFYCFLVFEEKAYWSLPRN